MKNLLAYETVSGKTQLRRYVKVAMGLFVLLGVLVGVNVYNRYQMVSGVMAEPRPLETGLIPIPTKAMAAAVPQLDECPSDPADWTLAGNLSVPGSNLKGLSPQCVRDQLDKTAAWFYATSVFGYSRKDAAALFGFSNIPMEFPFDKGRITIMTDFEDEPQMVTLRFPSDHADLKEWRIDENGDPAVEFTFSGCFRTSLMSGGEVVTWDDGYPIVCQYFADFQTRQLISDANGKILTIYGYQNHRRPMWFGYIGDGNWVFLGDAPALDIDLSRIPNRGPSTISPAVLVGKYGVSSRPLPENWTVFTDQESVEAFLKEMNPSE